MLEGDLFLKGRWMLLLKDPFKICFYKKGGKKKEKKKTN